MVTIRSVNEIILSLLDFYKIAQPDLSLLPGGVARDLFVDGPASQIAILYDEISSVANKGSIRLVEGSDLDKLAKNFGVTRKQATPSTGVALFTFSSINSTININRGDIVVAKNGFSYSVLNGISVNVASSNFYKSVAAKFRDQLNSAGISDLYAIEITVQATSSGTSGNIGKFSLSKTNVLGVNNVTNINPFVGGTDQEGDGLFRNRILSAFSGSSVGTVLGYQSASLSVDGVTDVTIVEPGSVLMTRDGTVVSTASDGSKTILSSGSGGKVDVVILGSKLIETTDSFIYRDKSNNNDPTNSKNNIILGQIVGDENKTINKRRIDNLKSGIVPEQPVENIINVIGSTSGGNFKEKSVDIFGRISGNYELIKDVGIYGGSPFGFDTFHWISDRINLFSEDKIKGQINGQDALTFSDVTEIPKIQQNVSIINENSIVTFDRSVIQLLHTPITNVTRVFNVNTGERYIVTNQNLNGVGSVNNTGKIKISGNTLPAPSDLLQVDYVWIVNYDQYSDYDGLFNTNNPRVVNDSVDWGLASVVTDERITFDKNINFFIGNSSLPINVVTSVKQFSEIDGYIETVSSGLFKNRLSVVLENLLTLTESIDSIKLKHSAVEIYNTSELGNFGSIPTVVGINIEYTTTIILPKDTLGKPGDKVTVILDSKDVFVNGTSSDKQITIPADQIGTTANSINLNVTYIANNLEMFNSSITDLPALKFGNGYHLNNLGTSNFSLTNNLNREFQTIKQNLSNQFYVELNLNSLEFSLVEEFIVSIIRLFDNKELWNSDHPGDIIISSNNNYQIIFSGFNNPILNDKVLILFYAKDLKRIQPFTYSNSIIKTQIDFLDFDTNVDKFFTSIVNFSHETNIQFDILEPNTDIVIATNSDGYLIPDIYSSNFGTGLDLSAITNIKSKKIKLSNSNNNGIYDIISYDANSNTLVISNSVEDLSVEQISVIRILDGKEIWNFSSSKDLISNRLLFSNSTKAAVGDKVLIIYYDYKNLKKSPTKLILTVNDQIINSGMLTVNGTTLNKGLDIVFTCTNAGLKINAAEALRKVLGLSSISALPTNIKLTKILKLEKVNTTNSNTDDVLNILCSYDLKNVKLNNILYSNDVVNDYSLSNFEFILPNTINNSLNSDTRNLPNIGDKLRITFYYTMDNDSENLSYTKNGTLYTNKQFALINKIFVSSGFTSSQSSKLVINSFTQPSLGARYSIFYDYLAPKQNERIAITYDYNRLISDTTFAIENVRTINADVLAREARLTLLDLTMNVVISDAMKNSTTTVLQNLKDKLLSALSTSTLGSVIDNPTLINVAQSVNGISRARIIYFNKTGSIGSISLFQAQADEYFAPNNIVINTETR